MIVEGSHPIRKVLCSLVACGTEDYSSRQKCPSRSLDLFPELFGNIGTSTSSDNFSTGGTRKKPDLSKPLARKPPWNIPSPTHR